MLFRCIAVVDNRCMKRALVLLLMVWIALQSALVQAHMVEESLHQSNHTVHVPDEGISDAHHEESCTVVVCGHPVAAFYSVGQLCWGQLSCSPPFTVRPLESAHSVHDIERPKWSMSAPEVAGI
jgi:hypothetical protein